MRALAVSDVPAPSADELRLPFAARHVRRKRFTTERGEDVLVDLPEPTELKDGDALHLEDGRTLAIRAAAEPLAEVRAPGATLARLAWHIGNRHTPCQIDGERLLIQRDHVLEDMLRTLGAAVAHLEAPFQPEGGAYGHGRTHAHAHAPHAHSDPNVHLGADD